MKRIAAASLLMAALLAGCAARAAVSATPEAVPATPLVGVYEPSVPDTWATVTGFSDATGLSPKIVLYYSTWHEKFKLNFAKMAQAHGSEVFVKLQPDNVTLASIAQGGSDAYLNAYAHAVRNFGHSVLISFAHEMNGNWYSWGVGHESPAEYVAAWRHVVQVFRNAGATNVSWVWTVDSITEAAGNLVRWWPGATWVNLVGVDGYYPKRSDSFSSVFGTTIKQVRSFSRAPVLIAETAVGLTADRDQQIKSLFAGARADYVRGLIWFDVDQSHDPTHQDWRLEGDPGAIAAFRTAARG